MDNPIDITLSSLPDDSLEKQLVIQDLLFFYLVWNECGKSEDRRNYAHFSVQQLYNYYLYAVCAFSWEDNKEDNLFNVYPKWCYNRPRLDAEYMTFFDDPFPCNLRRFASYQKHRCGENAFNFRFFYHINLIFDPSKPTEIAEHINSSALLSKYAKMIEVYLPKILKELGNYMCSEETLPIPPNCLVAPKEEDKNIWYYDNYFQQANRKQLAYEINKSYKVETNRHRIHLDEE